MPSLLSSKDPAYILIGRSPGFQHRSLRLPGFPVALCRTLNAGHSSGTAADFHRFPF